MGKCKDEMIKLINGEVEKVYIISEFETHYDISKSLQVWKYDDAIETNVVDVYIRYLRGKIDVPGKESYIQTVRGMGYVIREKWVNYKINYLVK